MSPDQVESILGQFVDKNRSQKDAEISRLKSELKAYEFFNKEVLPFLITQKLFCNGTATLHRYLDGKDIFDPNTLIGIINKYGWPCKYVNVSVHSDCHSVDVCAFIPRNSEYINTQSSPY